MKPGYNLDKIKYATDSPTFKKAVDLYEKGKVTRLKEEFGNFSSVVLGTQAYNVTVSSKYFDHGNCNCYLGQNDTLCKHMVATAIKAIKGNKKLTENEKKQINYPICSEKIGSLSPEQLAEVKGAITEALRCIKPYLGPSRIWFQYQDSLSEGCNRLSAIVSELPISEQTANLLVDLLLRLDKKLCTGGVDDSDGTVGNFIREVVEVLKEYDKIDSQCIKAFQKLCKQETCFEWEEPLVKIFDEQ